MTLIAVVDNQWGIGRQNDLLFALKEDMKRFRSATLGHTLVIGHNTLQSFPHGQPLKNRKHIVFSRAQGLQNTEQVEFVSSLEQFFARMDKTDSQVFVAGGAQIYALLEPFCDTALITKVHACGHADTFFPNLDTNPNWQLLSSQEVQDGEFKTEICRYVNLGCKTYENLK